MKEEDVVAIIDYRLSRANESLEEARILFEQQHINTFVSRLYYACYYSVSALLLKENLSSSKHSGTRSFLHQHFVKPGLLNKEQGQFYDKLFDNRQKCDYLDLMVFEADDVRAWQEEAQIFVDIITKLAKK